MVLKVGKRKMGPGFGDWRIVCGYDLKPEEFVADKDVFKNGENPPGYVFWNDERSEYPRFEGRDFMCEYARLNALAKTAVGFVVGSREFTSAEVFDWKDDGALLVLRSGPIFDVWCCVGVYEHIEDVEVEDGEAKNVEE